MTRKLGRNLDASSGLFTLAARDDSPPSPEKGSVPRVGMAVAASLFTRSGMVRRRVRRTSRGQAALRPRTVPDEGS
jgi:hypothetical protein